MIIPPLYHIESQELAAAAASVTFSNVDKKAPAWAKHLVVLVSARTDDAGITTDTCQVQVNGDTGSNYNYENLQGAGASPTAEIGTGVAFFGYFYVPGAAAAANVFGGGVLSLVDYRNTARHKSGLYMSGVGESIVALQAPRWADVSAITSILLKPGGAGDSFLATSTFHLYAVDESYAIHDETLGSDGTFTVTVPADSEPGDIVLVGNLRSDRAATDDNSKLYFNGDTTDGNYAQQTLTGQNNDEPTAVTGANSALGIHPAANATANVFGPMLALISQPKLGDNDPHYLALSGYHETGTPFGLVRARSGRRNNIAAVTSINLRPFTGTNFKSGSHLSAYRIPKRMLWREVIKDDTASVTIPVPGSGYAALVVNHYGRDDRAVKTNGVAVEFNGDTTDANYDVQYLLGGGTTVTAATSPNSNEIMTYNTSATEVANAYNGASLIVFEPGRSDRHKHVLAINGPQPERVILSSTRWENTAPITSIKLTPSSAANFIAGTVIEMWGIPLNNDWGNTAVSRRRRM